MRLKVIKKVMKTKQRKKYYTLIHQSPLILTNGRGKKKNGKLIHYYYVQTRWVFWFFDSVRFNKKETENSVFMREHAHRIRPQSQYVIISRKFMIVLTHVFFL